MSILETYKEIVSQVYKLTQLSYQHRDSSNEFDSFLDHLQDVLENKQSQVHIPPHVQIINEPMENVVVVKDETIKNITLRHIPPTDVEELKEDENELIPESTITSVDDGDDMRLAKDAIDATLDEEPLDIAQEIADAEAEGAEALAHTIGEELVLDDKDDEENDGEDKDLYIKTQKKVKYFVSTESKRVYEYIDDARHGPQIGKLENGKIVLM